MHPLLVPLDGSALADAMVPVAADLARRVKCPLHLVRVHTPVVSVAAPPELLIPPPNPAIDADLQKRAALWIEQRSGQVRAAESLDVTAECRVGSPAREIAESAGERAARAIVMSTHGAGGAAMAWLGSVADGVIRHAVCPVLAIPEPAIARATQVKRIAVLHDGSAFADTILPHAHWLAHAYGAALDLLRVVGIPLVGDAFGAVTSEDAFGIDEWAENAKQSLEKLAQAVRASGFEVTSTVLVDLNPARAILKHIEESGADAVALATHGRGVSRFLLGSVADKILRGARRPVLLFRPTTVP